MGKKTFFSEDFLFRFGFFERISVATNEGIQRFITYDVNKTEEIDYYVVLTKKIGKSI